VNRWEGINVIFLQEDKLIGNGDKKVKADKRIARPKRENLKLGRERKQKEEMKIRF